MSNILLFDFAHFFWLFFCMDSGAKVLLIAGIFLFTLLLNMPFGYFRGKAKRFSFKWFLYIHLPIPFVLLARLLSNIGMIYIPLFVLAAVMGQIWGGKLGVKP